ncbi:MAG TPA: c-type cytochrome [Aurantimonas sp.]
MALLVVLVGGQLLFSSGPLTDRSAWPSEFRSNGERIYFTATSASGQAITPQGANMHMMMSGGGCVACHGVDRGGGRLMPRFWQSAPPLTAAALFGGHDEVPEPGGATEEDGHGDHDSYTEDSLRRAIKEGVDPGGERLDPAMPRWSMTTEDMTDLISYLKTPVGGLE